MKKMHWKTVAAAGLISGTSFGAGFQLYTEGSAEALGQAGAISGRDDLISLAWYNPAALAGAERPSIMLGNTLVQLKTDYTGGGSDASMSDDWQSVPHLYYIQPISKDWTAMLSVNAPYGLISEWPDGWAGAAMAIYTELRTVYITPSVAWRPSETFSVGAGFNVVPSEAELTNTTFGELKGDDIGYGGMVSAHFQPLDNWALGARYQSRVDLSFEGKFNGSTPATASLTLPSTVNMGIANTSIKNLSLGFDFVWTEWSSYDYLTISGTPSPKLWNDVWSVRLGGEYALSESWMARAGYVWDKSPVPDATRAPEMPGSDRQMLTAGMGWKGNHIGIDVAYSYLWAEKADANLLPGEYETTTHLIALSASYEF